MSDPLAVTSEIWRKWQEQKIKPPMSWIELRKKVEAYIKEGKDPLTLQTEFVYETEKEQTMQERALSLSPHPKTEAVVEEAEIPTFSPAFLGVVEDSWKTKQIKSFWEWIMEPYSDGITVRLRGTTKPHEFFPKEIIEKMKYSKETEKYGVEKKKATTFIFETTHERDEALSILILKIPAAYNFKAEPPASITNIDEPDWALETLFDAGFDTAKVMVEKHE
jgi:hypothetical protein